MSPDERERLEGPVQPEQPQRRDSADSAERAESTQSQPLISIVLPTYNGSAYLAEAIQSVLEQTYPHWELLLVDDASTDGTPAIIADFAARDTRIRPLRHETNRRLPGALNTGFAHAHGELLTWTSDDNQYQPGALAQMAAVLEQEPTVDFVYADYDVVDELAQYLYTQSALSPTQLIQQHAGLPCFLYRRRVYERLGGYAEDLFLAEDYDYWLRVLGAGFTMWPLHTAADHPSLYRYRRHAASLTDVYRGRTFLAAEQALLRNLPLLSKQANADQGIGRDRAMLAEAYLYLASLATWRGDYRQSGRYALRASRYAPGRAAAHVGAFVVKRIRRLGGALSARLRPRRA